MVERGGEALIKVIPNMKGETVRNVVAESIAKGAEVHADMHVSYDQLRKQGYDLKRINKKALKAYVGPDGQSVNSVENFWRHLKKSIQSTHIGVSQSTLSDTPRNSNTALIAGCVLRRCWTSCFRGSLNWTLDHSVQFVEVAFWISLVFLDEVFDFTLLTGFS